METIKLLIWDLDETFWKGTLSDGEITPIPENIELVKKLTDRGIVNSICSKNDYEKTKAKLEELGVWDYFVFPSIDWTPKGQRAKNIISDMNLRPVNCLFIDDNVNNLEEVKFAAGDINVSLPDELPELVKDPAFDGKDDSEHSRLKQYKILEEKVAARAQSGSNEEFLYQSEIKVELIEDCSDKLVRIYEMIHRNNQLNFTKDRISQEEVDRIFTDPQIKSGVVHVTDKYGDHGIIGCYAVKDGRALQFVFSCRILGMGVEQWVYAELGYPDIEVVGEVAAELNKTDKPEWINRTDIVQEDNAVSKNDNMDTPRLIAYGACPLRPVAAYLQPCLPNFKFAEIDPTPCCLNLAVALRESDEQKQEWMSKVGPINNVFTFDKEIYDHKTGYILITLQGIEGMRKYKSKSTGAYFFAAGVNKQNTDLSFFEEYETSLISNDDIINELSYICDHLPSETKLMLQMIPEVEFPEIGKDNHYFYRIELNKIIEQMVAKYKCIHMIDIRKYAKTSADFFDPIVGHYRRNIAYYLSNDILEFMGVKSSDKTESSNIRLSDKIPENAITQTFGIPDSSETFEVITYICNGLFYAQIKFNDPSKYVLQYTVICNRHNEFVSTLTSETECKFNCSGPGLWNINAVIFNASNNIKIYEFSTASINYNKYNYINYIDPNFENYDDVILGSNVFINNNIFIDNYYNTIVNQLAELSSIGINISEYFLDQGIDEISMVIDERVGKLILPFLEKSKLKIKYLFTYDSCKKIKTECESYAIDDINQSVPVSKKDVVLFAFDSYKYQYAKAEFKKTKAQIYLLSYVITCLMTKYFFVNRFKNKIPKIIALRTANIFRNSSFEFSKLTANEKILDNKKFINESDVINKITNEYSDLPPQFGGISQEELLETMRFQKTHYEPNTNILKFNDVQGKYVNIKNGTRNTVGQPSGYVGTIYIFGGPHAFGYGVKDSETIASYLQKIIELPYRVENYANCWRYEYSYAMNLIDSMNFKENDIAVFVMANWQTPIIFDLYRHWLQWDAIEDPIIKVDAFPLFEKADRPDYFLHKLGFTPKGNLELAKLIRDAVYSAIKLF